ncbi:MAG: hypothetical protein ABIW19_20475 [Vicinamibacterales bacterium]
MPIASALYPRQCHLAYISGPIRSDDRTAVWICEYPYRTMRMAGPSADCGDCPIWQDMQRVKAGVAAAAVSAHAYDDADEGVTQGVLAF